MALLGRVAAAAVWYLIQIPQAVAAVQAVTLITDVTKLTQGIVVVMVVVVAQLATTHQPTVQVEAVVLASEAKVTTVHVAIPAQAMVHQAEPAKADPEELVANMENHIQTVKVTDLPAADAMVAVAAVVAPVKAVAGAALVVFVLCGAQADRTQVPTQVIYNRLTEIVKT